MMLYLLTCIPRSIALIGCHDTDGHALWIIMASPVIHYVSRLFESVDTCGGQ